MDSDINSITGQAKEIVAHLNILSQNNPEKFVEVLKALAPSVSPIIHSKTQSQNQQLFNLVSTRMDSGNIGLSGGDIFKNVGLWAQGLYNKTKYTIKDGFDGKSSGIALGCDAYITDNMKLGLGFAYTDSSIDAIGRDVSVDNYSLFLYGEQLFDNIYINSILNYNFSKYNEDKNVSGIIIEGDYNANSIGAQILSGYNFDNGFSPEISAMLTYDLVNSSDSSIVSLPNGSIYEIKGEKLEKFGGELGLKVNFIINDFEFSLKYERQFKKDFTNNSAIINFRYNF